MFVNDPEEIVLHERESTLSPSMAPSASPEATPSNYGSLSPSASSVSRNFFRPKDRNLRESSRTLLATGTTFPDPIFVRVIAFGEGLSWNEYEETSGKVRTQVKKWISKYSGVPNVLLPTLLQTRYLGEASVGQLILATPRAPTLTLKDYYDAWVNRSPRPLTNAEKEQGLAYLIRETLKPLKALHEKGLVHGSVKCSNVVVDSFDFGSSIQLHLIDVGFHDLEPAVGSLRLNSSNYLSPPEVTEKAASSSSEKIAEDASAVPGICPESCTPEADVWGLGLTIIDIADGNPPPHRRLAGMKSHYPTVIPMLKSSSWSAAFRAFQVDCSQLQKEKRPTTMALIEKPFLHNASSMTCINDAIAVAAQQQSRPSGSLCPTAECSPSKAPHAEAAVGEEAVPSGEKPEGGEFVHLIPQADEDPGASSPLPGGEESPESPDNESPFPGASGTFPRGGEGTEGLSGTSGCQDIVTFVIYQALQDILVEREEDYAEIGRLCAAVTRCQQFDSALTTDWVFQLLEGMAASPDIDPVLKEKARDLRSSIGKPNPMDLLRQQGGGTSSGQKRSGNPTPSATQGTNASDHSACSGNSAAKKSQPLERADYNSYLHGKWASSSVDALRRHTNEDPGSPQGAGGPRDSSSSTTRRQPALG